MAKLERDGLTGLRTRTAFAGDFAKLTSEESVALAMIDFDGFKTINDEHGHAVGDELLRSHAQTIAGSLPNEAVVARFGGDEFVVALPRMTAESALILLEEIRSYLAAHVVTAVGHPVAISVGVAARPPHGATLEELLRAADSAMYRAKAEGRNRVAIFVDEKMVMKSNYYDRAALARLAKLSEHVGRTEASLLREALDDLFEKYKDQL